MKSTYYLILVLFLIPHASVAEEDNPSQIYHNRNLSEDEIRNTIPGEKSLDEVSDGTHAKKRKPALPQFVPNHWHQDYDYEKQFENYLNEKFIAAKNNHKQVYVYLYADWLEKCREFRKLADRAPLTALFDDNEIIMIEYNYFKRKFNMKARHLPMILKVNEDGKLGPETIYPVTKAKDHPRKVYHKLRKFFAT